MDRAVAGSWPARKRKDSQEGACGLRSWVTGRPQTDNLWLNKIKIRKCISRVPIMNCIIKQDQKSKKNPRLTHTQIIMKKWKVREEVRSCLLKSLCVSPFAFKFIPAYQCLCIRVVISAFPCGWGSRGWLAAKRIKFLENWLFLCRFYAITKFKLVWRRKRLSFILY